jgi:hypothetical protein
VDVAKLKAKATATAEDARKKPKLTTGNVTLKPVE